MKYTKSKKKGQWFKLEIPLDSKENWNLVSGIVKAIHEWKKSLKQGGANARNRRKEADKKAKKSCLSRV